MEQGKIYQLIEGEITEVVRFGSEIVPNNPEGLGQLVLNLTYGEGNE